MAEYGIGDSAITDWLKQVIYPAVLEALQIRSKAVVPGSAVPDSELRSLRLKRRHDIPEETKVPEEEITEELISEDEWPGTN